MTTLFLQHIGCHHSHSHIDEKSLRSTLKTRHQYDGRRLSRFTMHALCAALTLKPPSQSGIYLGARFSSPAKFDNMLTTLAQGSTPKPFDFTGNIHNAACFHVAQALGLYGPSLFLPVVAASTSWSQPLLTAALDIQQNTVTAALVGWCSEQSASLPPQAEGCCWLLLSAQQQANSIAAIHIRAATNRDVFSHIPQCADVYLFACHVIAHIQANKHTVLPAALNKVMVIDRLNPCRRPQS